MIKTISFIIIAFACMNHTYIFAAGKIDNVAQKIDVSNAKITTCNSSTTNINVETFGNKKYEQNSGIQIGVIKNNNSKVNSINQVLKFNNAKITSDK